MTQAPRPTLKTYRGRSPEQATAAFEADRAAAERAGMQVARAWWDTTQPMPTIVVEYQPPSSSLWGDIGRLAVALAIGSVVLLLAMSIDWGGDSSSDDPPTAAPRPAATPRATEPGSSDDPPTAAPRPAATPRATEPGSSDDPPTAAPRPAATPRATEPGSSDDPPTAAPRPAATPRATEPGSSDDPPTAAPRPAATPRATEPGSYVSMTCAEWIDSLSARDRLLAAREMLTSLRRTDSVSAAEPDVGLGSDFLDVMDAACRVPGADDWEIAQVAAAAYALEQDRYSP